MQGINAEPLTHEIEMEARPVPVLEESHADFADDADFFGVKRGEE